MSQALPPPRPFSAQDLQAQGDAIRKRARDKFLAQGFPRKLFEGPLNSGRFDIELSPRDGTLYVHLKVFFNFVDSGVPDGSVAQRLPGDSDTWYRRTWQGAEQDEWKRQFKANAERVWNNHNIRFRCTRPGWEDITLRPTLVVETVTTRTQAHYEVKVEKTVLKTEARPFPAALGDKRHIGAGYTRVRGQREQFKDDWAKKNRILTANAVKLEGRANVGANRDAKTGAHVDVPVAQLNQMDVEERVGSCGCGGHLHAIAIENFATAAADYDRNQVVRALAESGVATLRYKKHETTLAPESVEALRKLAARLKAVYANPSSEALAKTIKLEATIQTDKAEDAALAGRRATALSALLAELGVLNPVVVKDTKRHLPHRDRPAHGVLDDGAKFVDSVSLAVEQRATVEQAYFAAYKYMTVPHEVGHMLGLTDEYATADDELLIRKMVQDGVLAAEAAQALAPCGRFNDAQRVWARLCGQFELVTPAFATASKAQWSADRHSPSNYQAATTSLMSAGFNLAPQHFIIIGLALQEYTEPYTTWDIDRQLETAARELDTKAFGSSAKTFAAAKRRFMWRIERG